MTKSRRYSLNCVECMFGLGSMHTITAEETSSILILGKCDVSTVYIINCNYIFYV